MRNESYLLINFFFFLLFTISISAENGSYIFKRLGIEEGLSQSTIHSIIQDTEGFIWIGTSNGLNRYDGYNFNVFKNDPNDSTSISDNGITSLYENKEGKLWVGTIKGILNEYDRTSGTFIHYNLENISTPVHTQEEEFYEYPIIFSRNDDNSITTIAEDNSGNLWIGTWGKGILIFNKNSNQIKHYYHISNNAGSLSYNRIMKILIDNTGTIWIGTFGGGLDRILENPNFSSKNNETDKLTFIHYKKDLSDRNSLSDNKIVSLFEDNKHNLWIGTYNGGLNELTAVQKSLSPSVVKFIHYEKKDHGNNIGNNSIMSILQDSLNSLWIGTFGGGLTKFDLENKTFTHFLHDPLNENSLSGNDVTSLCEDASGILWIGTHLGEGVNELKMSKIKFGIIKNIPADKNSLNDDVVWSILEDNQKKLWIGTYHGGLNEYDMKNNKFYHYKHNDKDPFSISDNHIRSLAQDKYGSLWVGTYSGGLNKFNPKSGKFNSYTHNPDDPASIGSNQIQDIYIDSASNVWIAAFSGGLNKFKLPVRNDNKIQFEHFVNDPSDPNSLSDDRVYTIFEDSRGTIWIGTFGGGLDKFDKKKKIFKHYKNKSGDIHSLSDNRVISIFEDSKKDLWIGTYGGGLNKFDRVSGKFARYKNKYELNCDVVYGMLEDKNKNIWFSSDNGIFRFNIVSKFVTHYDIQDGLQSTEFSGGAYFKAKDGEMFFGGINGLNYFYPDSIGRNSYIPPVVITSVKVFNAPIKGEKKEITLSYNENFISFEFSALDFSNPEDNHYAYKLIGLQNNWQYVTSGFRTATYTNLSPGQYTFIVKGSNSDRVWNPRGAVIIINILPPFWKTWWFIAFSILLGAVIIYYFSTVRIKNLLAIERLKTKLAADLHDNIGAGLTEISIMSELATKLNGNSSKGSDDLKKISERARQLVDSMSDIIWVVNPKKDSLHDLIVRLKDSNSDFLESIGIRLKTTNLEKLEDIKLPMEYKQNLYLIFKEGINNCIKHSKCSYIFLEARIQGEVIEIKLTDNGSGFVFHNEKEGNGLFNMRRRAEMIRGEIKWESQPGKGTTVTFSGKAGNINKIKSFINL